MYACCIELGPKLYIERESTRDMNSFRYCQQTEEITDSPSKKKKKKITDS
jgi:hypothetical protein